jgi:hypothetical protein
MVKKHEANRPLGRSRRRWEDNIKIYLKEIGDKGVDWIHVAQNRGQWRGLVNTAMKLRILLNAPNLLYG